MPSPPTAFTPKSQCLLNKDHRPLAPMPPPVVLALVAPKLLTTVGVADKQLPVSSVGTAGGAVSFPLVPTTPQG